MLSDKAVFTNFFGEFTGQYGVESLDEFGEVIPPCEGGVWLNLMNIE
jgi:hypothetical protein